MSSGSAVRSQPWRLVTAGVVLAAVLAGCGDDDGQSQTVTTSAATETTEAAQSTSMDVIEPTTTVEETTVPPSTATALLDDPAQYLLALEDLPPGYTPSPASGDDSGETTTDPPECAVAFEPVQAPVEAEAQWQQSELGPFILQVVAGYGDETEAEAAVDAFVAAANTCQAFTETDTSGEQTTYTFAPLSLPMYGDETFAAALSANAGPLPATFQIAVIREGQWLTLVGVGGLTGTPLAGGMT